MNCDTVGNKLVNTTLKLQWLVQTCVNHMRLRSNIENSLSVVDVIKLFLEEI